MPATMKDIAQKLNVSRTTVSFVLNGRKDNYISAAVRQRILKTANEMNYSPNRMARALVTGKTHTIGFRADVTRSYYAESLQYLQKACQEDGYSIMVTGYSNHTAEENVSESGLWPVDGMIVYDKLVKADPTDIHNLLPTVCIGALAGGDVDCVAVDIMLGSQEAMQHLIGIGCKRIAYLNPTRMDVRRYCYTENMKKAGMSLEYIDFKDETIENSRMSLMAYSDRHGCPDGIFCCNDEFALGAYSAILDMGLSMPDDVAIVGCNGTRETIYVRPSISTIDLLTEEACLLAWKMLLNRINDPASPVRKVMLKSRLEIRGSSNRHKLDAGNVN